MAGVASGNEKFNASLKKTNALYRNIQDTYKGMLSGKNGASSNAVANFKNMLSEFNTATKDSYKALQGTMKTEDYTKNYQSLRSYIAQMHRMSQELVGSPQKYTGSKSLEASYKRVMGMYSSMSTQLNKMASGEKGLLSNKMVSTASAMLEKYRAQLNEIEVLQRKVFSGSGSTGGTASAYKSSQSTQQSVVAKKYIDRIEKEFSQFDKMFSGYMTSGRPIKFDRFSDIQGVYEKYAAIERLKNSITEGVASKNQFAPSDMRELVSMYEKIKACKQDVLSLSQRETSFGNLNLQSLNQTLASEKQILATRQKLSSFLTSNTRMMGTDGYGQVSSMLNELKSGGTVTVGRLNEIDSALARVNQSAVVAGKTGNSLATTFASALGKFGTWALVTNVLMTGSKAMHQLVTNVRELDAAMTELRKVTDETESTYDTFFDNAADRARNVGATMTDTITATADFARLGYSVDDASKLADAALVYKNVGDDISDITTASQSITSTMQAFGVEADDVMSIVDKFNEVGKIIAQRRGNTSQANSYIG